MSRLVPRPVWVYLVRGTLLPDIEILSREPEVREFCRDFSEKGVPVLLDNPHGEGVRDALHDTIMASCIQSKDPREDPERWAEQFVPRKVTEVRLLGKTYRPGDRLTPTAFPKETR